MCDALCNLVPFIQLKTWKSSIEECFSRCLNYINGIKSRSAPYVVTINLLQTREVLGITMRFLRYEYFQNILYTNNYWLGIKQWCKQKEQDKSRDYWIISTLSNPKTQTMSRVKKILGDQVQFIFGYNWKNKKRPSKAYTEKYFQWTERSLTFENTGQLIIFLRKYYE